MQLKYSFKKEWSQFARTGRIFGVIAAIFSFALSSPLMFKFVAVVLEMVDPTSLAAVTMDGIDDLGGLMGSVSFDEMLSVYADAGMMFVLTVSSFCGASLLIVMMILMSAAGGEQKKRAMIVPMCSGLEYKNYLIPKFVIYPLIVFGTTLISGVTAGLLCNALFAENKTSGGIILLISLMTAVYTLFITCVFLCIGLCTSRPGVATVLIYIGQSFLRSIFMSMGLTDYNPFTLTILPNYMTAEDFDLGASTPSIIVGIALSIIVAVMMYFLSLGVLNAKRIDNTEDEKPEF
ncbi:MAG: hypothetical protein NC299_05930 [Lachnospiraceae bacterium]|nr:hypothetical protein [Ruminococcus sp.]MCM1274891.1 hypothetical protein [Lachnospiraceae bacterium]